VILGISGSGMFCERQTAEQRKAVTTNTAGNTFPFIAGHDCPGRLAGFPRHFTLSMYSGIKRNDSLLRPE